MTTTLPDKLYVVAVEASDYAEKDIWTVSAYPDLPGWETDGGFDGYGLPKALAEEIARRYNRGP